MPDFVRTVYVVVERSFVRDVSHCGAEDVLVVRGIIVAVDVCVYWFCTASCGSAAGGRWPGRFVDGYLGGGSPFVLCFRELGFGHLCG